MLGGQGGECAWGHDDINLERNQFGRKSGEPLELPLGISVFDHDVAALDVTEVTQSLEEGLLQVGTSGQVGRQVAYSSDLGRLLGLGGERPPTAAPPRKPNELPPPHSTLYSQMTRPAYQMISHMALWRLLHRNVAQLAELRVMCGRRPRVKGFLASACGRVQVMCPACLRGAHDRWP